MDWRKTPVMPLLEMSVLVAKKRFNMEEQRLTRSSPAISAARRACCSVYDSVRTAPAATALSMVTASYTIKHTRD
jgi:hypothetical protein